MNAGEPSIGKVLAQQFSSSWKMLRQAMENSPEDLLYEVVNDWSQIMTFYHVIETANFYCQSSPEGFPWGERGGIDWNDQTLNLEERIRSLSVKDLLVYLDETEKKIDSFLNETPDEEFFRDDGFKKYLGNILNKYLYLLRHNAHHIGEITKTMRTKGLERIIWD